MKRGLVAVGAVALLLLTGCTSTVTSETITVTPGASGTFSNGDTTVVAEPPASPSAAGPVEVTATAPASAAEDSTGEAQQFLVKMQLALDNWGVTMNAAQVSSAANYVCDELAAGAPLGEVVAITGDVPDYANGDFVDLVGQGYCPIR